MKHANFLTYLFMSSIAFVSYALAHTVTTETDEFPDDGPHRPKLRIDLFDTGPIDLQEGTQIHQVPAGAHRGILLLYKNPKTGRAGGPDGMGGINCLVQGKWVGHPPAKDLHFKIHYDSESGEFTCIDNVDEV